MTANPVGRRLGPRRAVRTRAVLVGAAVLGMVATGIGLGLQTRADAGCGAAITVLAAPEMVPVLTTVAGFAMRDSDPDCARPAIRAADPAEAARGLGSAGDGTPDVWVPDSSVWTTVAAARGLALPLDAPSLAYTPVVLAAARPTAEAHGWPARPLRLAALLGDDPAGRPVRLGLPDPDRSSVTIGGLLGLQEALAARPDARGALTAQLRGALRGQPTEREPLLARLFAGDDAPAAVPSTEQAVWAHNLSRASADVVAAYPGGGATALDYPYVVLANDAAARDTAQRLLAAARTAGAREALWARGFRAADATAGPGMTVELGTDRGAVAVTTVPSFESVDLAIRTLAAVNLDSRVLAVIDVSGSMGEVVAGARGANRLDLVRTAAGQALGLFPDTSEVGLWVFATRLAGAADHRELVPIGPLAAELDGDTRKRALARSLGGLRPTHGDTGLYDTALAAVREVRRSWRPGAVNSVVLLTDGRNEDAEGIDLAGLLRTLAAEDDPGRPVPVITIAYGPGSDEQTLAAISRVTRGSALVARDPLRVREVFLEAIGQRLCRPDC